MGFVCVGESVIVSVSVCLWVCVCVYILTTVVGSE